MGRLAKFRMKWTGHRERMDGPPTNNGICLLGEEEGRTCVA